MAISVELALVVGTTLFCYFTYLVFDRFYLSPIAQFPGPKLAALTFWFEGYYDVLLRGQYNKRVLRMHERYGPIVRISPSELHIMDPDFYDTVYCHGNKRVNKWNRQMQGFAGGNSGFETVDHALHQARRAPLATSFSKRAVSQLEPAITGYIDQLVIRLENFRESALPVNLFHAYSALTSDIINGYSFGISQGFLTSSDFSPQWYELIMVAERATFFFKHLGDPNAVLGLLPDWLTNKIYPVQMLQYRRLLEERLLKVRDAKAEDKSKARTAFHDIFDSNLPQSEKAVPRLIDEAIALTAAGTITTADTLAVVSYHIISNTSVLARLQEELRSAPGQSLQQLEQLPYLTTVIKEGLRLACGVTSRLARIFLDAPLQYKDWIIPPGTPISMSAQLVHYDPSIFPQPSTFRPERWLVNNSTPERRLDKYLVPFSKGSRQCIGINLAYAEMYLTLAAVFAPGRLNFELFETTERDAEVVADVFVPGFRQDSKGIRVKVK